MRTGILVVLLSLSACSAAVKESIASRDGKSSEPIGSSAGVSGAFGELLDAEQVTARELNALCNGRAFRNTNLVGQFEAAPVRGLVLYFEEGRYPQGQFTTKPIFLNHRSFGVSKVLYRNELGGFLAVTFGNPTEPEVKDPNLLVGIARQLRMRSDIRFITPLCEYDDEAVGCPACRASDTSDCVPRTVRGPRTNRDRMTASPMEPLPTHLDAISAQGAWSKFATSTPVIVGVLDSGIDQDHPELTLNLWRNNAAGSRYHHGKNFVSNGCDISDSEEHGTSMAGLIGAVANNGSEGTLGVSWRPQIMTLKIKCADEVSPLDVAEAIEWGREKGAKVFNFSYSLCYSEDSAWPIHAAISGATDSLFVTSAGVDCAIDDDDASAQYCLNSPICGNHPYPDHWTMNNLLVVAQSNLSGDGLVDSSWGTTSVDMAAPGEDILTVVPGDYMTNSGSSNSAALVSGAAALIWGHCKDLKAPELRCLLMCKGRDGDMPTASGNILDLGFLESPKACSDIPITSAGDCDCIGSPTSASSP